MSSCSGNLDPDTTWIINKLDGTSDTIQAKTYWILSKDTLFIEFKTQEGRDIIYPKSGIESMERKTRAL